MLDPKKFSINSREYTPAHLLAAEIVYGGDGDVTEEDIARIVQIKPKHLRVIMDGLVFANIISYPDHKRPRVWMDYAKLPLPQFLATVESRLPRQKLWWEMVRLEDLRASALSKKTAATSRRDFQLECGAWDECLPDGLKWTDEHVGAALTLWEKDRSGNGVEFLDLAKELGQRHGALMCFLRQFDFCAGLPGLCNITESAARVYSRGDVGLYAEIMARSKEAVKKLSERKKK